MSNKALYPFCSIHFQTMNFRYSLNSIHCARQILRNHAHSRDFFANFFSYCRCSIDCIGIIWKSIEQLFLCTFYLAATTCRVIFARSLSISVFSFHFEFFFQLLKALFNHKYTLNNGLRYDYLAKYTQNMRKK